MKKILSFAIIAAMSIYTAAATNGQVSDKTKKSEKTEKTEVAKDVVEKTTFVVDIDCDACVKTVMDNIPYITGVKDVEVLLAKRHVIVSFDPSKTNNTKIIKGFKKIKKTAEVL
ncbi:MAG: heavy-metal-associated domain-containing protein [Rikenellaceae bacterium]